MHGISISLIALTLVACATPTEEVSRPATFVRSVAPVYPPYARRYEIQGTAHVRIRVRSDGRVGEVQVQLSSGSPYLDAAAVDAARKSEFHPAQTRSGKSVESWVVAPYIFRLE
jgi:TonB family protein